MADRELRENRDFVSGKISGYDIFEDDKKVGKIIRRMKGGISEPSYPVDTEYDSEGGFVSESRVRTDSYGEEQTVKRDAEGEIISRTKREKSITGETRDVERDVWDGEVISTTKPNTWKRGLAQKLTPRRRQAGESESEWWIKFILILGIIFLIVAAILSALVGCAIGCGAGAAAGLAWMRWGNKESEPARGFFSIAGLVTTLGAWAGAGLAMWAYSGTVLYEAGHPLMLGVGIGAALSPWPAWMLFTHFLEHPAKSRVLPGVVLVMVATVPFFIGEMIGLERRYSPANVPEHEAIMDVMRLDFYGPGGKEAAHQNARGIVFKELHYKVQGDWALTCVDPYDSQGNHKGEPRWGLLQKKGGEWMNVNYFEALRPFDSEDAAEYALDMSSDTVQKLWRVFPSVPHDIFPERKAMSAKTSAGPAEVKPPIVEAPIFPAGKVETERVEALELMVQCKGAIKARDWAAALGYAKKLADRFPEDPTALNWYANLRATIPDAKYRDGQEAVKVALSACAKSNWKDPDIVDTLAAAHAETGNFSEAEKFQRQAMDLLRGDQTSDGQMDIYSAHLHLFYGKQPVRILDENTAPGAIIEGFRVVIGSISPDGRYGVLVPDLEHYNHGKTHQNQVVEIRMGRVVATIEATTYVKGDNAHAGFEALWSSDSTILSWCMSDRKWGTQGCVLMKIRDGAVVWQTDVLEPAHREMERQFKAQNRDPDFGMGLDVNTNHTLVMPMRYRVESTDNPKAFENRATVEAKMQATVDDDGRISYSDFNLTATPAVKPEPPALPNPATLFAPQKEVDWKGEKYPQTRTGIIALFEAKRLSLGQLRYAINEMYARHGYYYTDDALRSAFERMPWYRPDRSLTTDSVEASFSQVEKNNLETLAAAKKEATQLPKNLEALSGIQGASPVTTTTVLPSKNAPVAGGNMATLDMARVQLEINRVYARYGTEFGGGEVQAWADRQPGYRKIPGRTKAAAETFFSPADRALIESLAARRNQLK